MKEREIKQPPFKERLRRITRSYELSRDAMVDPQNKAQLLDMYINMLDRLYEIRFDRTRPSEEGKKLWEEA